MFLRDGYGEASIDKVASEAGVSTRTIYERFKNKADLFGAVIERLVERDVGVSLALEELEQLSPVDALTFIGRWVNQCAREPETAALFRIIVTESHRFPELANKMRTHAKERIDSAVAAYLRQQTERGTFRLGDPDQAAELFLQMACAKLQECLLFGPVDGLADLDCTAQIDQAVELFLRGALPRSSNPTADPNDASI